MIYFGFIELIEKGIKWAKEFPKPVNPVFYWGSSFVFGYLLSAFYSNWVKCGFATAKPLLILAITFYGCVVAVIFFILLFDAIKNKRWRSEAQHDE